KEAFKGQVSQAVELIDEKMNENGLDKYAKDASELLEHYSAQDLAALLLKTLAKDPAESVPVKITPERPLPKGKSNKGRRKNYSRDRNNGNRRKNNNDYYKKNNKNQGNKNSYPKKSRRGNEKKQDFVIRNGKG
ncbi:MAG: ATP-dependent RNA helicase, partial [Tetragenococcus koreensis]|nr:ATP-dependent RNA helicase [Tetragenococcus halophilus]MDN6848156.1 ATP-dependent RNA helicase [Tetragenococcus koreensis]